MVLKRKLPTQVAQEKEADKQPKKTEQNDKKETQDSKEPWVFSAGDSSEKPKDEPEKASPKEPKTDDKPAPWSVESLGVSNKPKEKATEKAASSKDEATSSSSSSTGDYPWAINPSSGGDGWKIDDDIATKSTSQNEKPPLAPTNDIYSNVVKDDIARKASNKAGTPPWQQSSASGGNSTPPPILPLTSVKHEGGILKSIIMLFIVGGILVVGYLALFQKRDEVAEVTGRWTGALNEISQKVESLNEEDPKPEDIVFGFGNDKKLPKVDKKDENTTKQADNSNNEPTLQDSIMKEIVVKKSDKKPNKDKEIAKKQPSTSVDFVDVPKKEAKKPIVADEETKMPKELSLFASLQEAIMKEKEVKRTEDMAKESEDTPTVDPDTLTPEEKVAIGQKLRKKTNKEMDEYIKTLVKIKNPALKPKPGTFFKNPEKYTEKANNYKLHKVEPKEEEFTYKSNPKNLPVIPEPTVPTRPGVRTLADFSDDIFEEPKSKVRMPRKLTPKMGVAGFPALEILSLVPHKGIIAFAKGKEGILMIGEEIEGWELTYVQNEYAEFHNGKRKHIVSLETIR